VVVHSLYPGTSSATLACGLQVLVEEVPTSRSVSAGIWIRGGSRRDPDNASGMAHAIEHLLFKGTTSRSAQQISCEIEDVGGHINAATGKESTLVYAEAPAESLATVLDVLADVVLRPRLNEHDLERERGVLLEEIRSRDDDPEQCAYELFAQEIWDPPHPLGRSVLGTRETVDGLTTATIARRHEEEYTAANAVLVVCGRTDITAIIDGLDHRVAKLRPGTEAACAPPASRTVGHRFHRRPSEQSHVYLAFPAPPASAADRFALHILNSILGDGASSRLFQSVREERGLAYAVSSGVTQFSDTGVWTFYAGVSVENAAIVRRLIAEELEAVRSTGVTSEEIRRAKAKLRGQVVLGLESNSHRMARLGSSVVLRREILSPESALARLDEVSPEDVAAAIESYILPESVYSAEIGPERRHP